MDALRICLLFVGLLLLGTASSQSNPSLIGVGDWTGDLRIIFDEPASANAPVIATVPSDGCFASGQRIDPDQTVVSVSGQSITIDFHSFNLICFSAGDPPGVWRHEQSLGLLPAGNYSVTARYYYIENPGSAPFAVLSAPVVVGGGPAITALPSLSSWNAGLMALLLGLTGWKYMKRRRLRS